MMLKADKISVGYGGRPIVSDISFIIGKGECVLLCGSNGTGKSTLLRTLAGLSVPVAGALDKDCDVVLMPSRISKVRGFTVREFMRVSEIWAEGFNNGSEKAIESAIAVLGMSGVADKDIASLSDGEFQKACVASALSRKAGIILLDEPTSFLDVENRISVLSALKNICSDTGCSIIFSSHDISDSLRTCSRVFGISPERKFIDSAVNGPAENVVRACFRNFYGASW